MGGLLTKFVCTSRMYDFVYKHICISCKIAGEFHRIYRMLTVMKSHDVLQAVAGVIGIDSWDYSKKIQEE